MSRYPDFKRPSRRALLAGTAGIALGSLALDAAAATDDDILSQQAVLRDPDIPAAGNLDGDITIVEFFDYQCPHCRKIEPDLRGVVKDDGKVRLVFKDWPVLGPVSTLASRLVLAARYQDKFIQAHDALFAQQSRLTDGNVPQTLVGAGVDIDRAMRDLDTNGKNIDAVIARNDAQAKALGFVGTPSFIIGQFRVPGGLTPDQFKQAIADARAAAKK